MGFAEFRLPWRKRHALLVVLGHSRLMWLQYYERQTIPVVMWGLESAFRYFRSVPSELLFNQMKAVVIEDGRRDGHWHTVQLEAGRSTTLGPPCLQYPDLSDAGFRSLPYGYGAAAREPDEH